MRRYDLFMSEDYKPITFTDEFIKEYWDGNQNRIVRYQNYLRRGLSLFNETKNYILLLFGSYWTIKTSDYWLAFTIADSWLVVGLGIVAGTGLIALLFLGRWDLFRAQKATEFINNRHGTITGYNSYNMTIRRVEQGDEIIDLLKKLNK